MTAVVTDYQIEKHLTDKQTKEIEALQKMTRALKKSAGGMGRKEIRSIIDLRDSAQRQRLLMEGKLRALAQGYDGPLAGQSGPALNNRLKPMGVDDLMDFLEDEESKEMYPLQRFFLRQFKIVEDQMTGPIEAWVEGQRPGRWLLARDGIGPILAANFLAHFDITRAPYAGHFWSYAGLTQREWLGAVKAEAVVKEIEETFQPGDMEQLLALCAQKVKRNPANLRAMAMEIGRDKKLKRSTGGEEEGTDEFPEFIDGEDAEDGDVLPDEEQVVDEPRLTRKLIVSALAMRPWNAALKRAFFLAGESWIKLQGKPTAYYAQRFVMKRAAMMMAMANGEWSDKCAAILAAKSYRKTTQSYKWYAGCYPASAIGAFFGASVLPAPDLDGLTGEEAKAEMAKWKAEKKSILTRRAAVMKRLLGAPGSGVPMLPPRHLVMASLRPVKQLFAAHLHAVMYEDHYGKTPPEPYIIAYDPQHSVYLARPGWPCK